MEQVKVGATSPLSRSRWRRPAQRRRRRDVPGISPETECNPEQTVGKHSAWGNRNEFESCTHAVCDREEKPHSTDREKGVPRDARQTVWPGLAGQGIEWHLFLYLLRQPVDSYINLPGDDCFRDCGVYTRRHSLGTDLEGP